MSNVGYHEYVGNRLQESKRTIINLICYPESRFVSPTVIINFYEMTQIRAHVATYNVRIHSSELVARDFGALTESENVSAITITHLAGRLEGIYCIVSPFPDSQDKLYSIKINARNEIKCKKYLYKKNP